MTADLAEFSTCEDHLQPVTDSFPLQWTASHGGGRQ